MNKIKKILPIILAFVLVFGSCLTVSASTDINLSTIDSCDLSVPIDANKPYNIMFKVDSTYWILTMQYEITSSSNLYGLEMFSKSDDTTRIYKVGENGLMAYMAPSASSYNRSFSSAMGDIGANASNLYRSGFDILDSNGDVFFRGPVPPNTDNTYSNEETEGSILVTAEVGSTYTISLPATLALTYNQTTGLHEGEYTVGVQANLTGSEAIKVAPNSTVSLTNGDGVTVEGDVAQQKNTWKLTASAENEITSDYTQFVETTGKITANISRSGSYSGTLNFTFTKIQ